MTEDNEKNPDALGSIHPQKMWSNQSPSRPTNTMVTIHPADWRRALEVLANSPEGAIEAVQVAHGFTSETITGLVDTGLATATIEPFLAAARSR